MTKPTDTLALTSAQLAGLRRAQRLDAEASRLGSQLPHLRGPAHTQTQSKVNVLRIDSLAIKETIGLVDPRVFALSTRRRLAAIGPQATRASLLRLAESSGRVGEVARAEVRSRQRDLDFVALETAVAPIDDSGALFMP